eukprot:jgi/Botrbrau1/197/Bobra.0022s0177.1
MERWRARLGVVQDVEQEAEQGGGERDIEGVADEEAPCAQGEPPRDGGEFQFLSETEQAQKGDTQGLAPATEEQAEAARLRDVRENDLDLPTADEEVQDQVDEPGQDSPLEDEQPSRMEAAVVKAQGSRRPAGPQPALLEEEEDMDRHQQEAQDEEMRDAVLEDDSERGPLGESLVKTRLELPNSLDHHLPASGEMEEVQEAPEEEAVERMREEMERMLEEAAAGILPQGEEEYGRQMWARCEALTAGLAGELTEQLRLILEPTKARRLAGAFRTGKRIAMRRVIAYVASHFRKDKIWLRRTHPDSRKYQVVLAVDDSRSMAENHTGGFAAEASTLLLRALARLEVGEVAVLRYGGSGAIAPLHPLSRPFSDADGPRVLSNLRFDKENTVADTPLQDLMSCLLQMLEEAAGRADLPGGGGGGGPHILHQLVIILGDGHIHEKDKLRRLVAEAATRRGLLLAYIVLDNPAGVVGGGKSLLDMRSIDFSSPDGTPRVTPYLDSFPFPFYIVLRDLAALPRTLADLLRQWVQLSTLE